MGWHSFKANEYPRWACLSRGSGHTAKSGLVLCAVGHHLVADACTGLPTNGQSGGCPVLRDSRESSGNSWMLLTGHLASVWWGLIQARWTGKILGTENPILLNPTFWTGVSWHFPSGLNLLPRSFLFQTENQGCPPPMFYLNFLKPLFNAGSRQQDSWFNVTP